MANDKGLSIVRAGELKLPEAVRVRLSGLYRLRHEADIALQGPVATALEFLGLDPHQPHTIDFDTGIVTPAKVPTPNDAADPEPAKDEAVS